MGKLKSDKQRAKHVYLVLEMLNNYKIKGLKISLKIWEKIVIRTGKHPVSLLVHSAHNPFYGGKHVIFTLKMVGPNDSNTEKN